MSITEQIAKLSQGLPPDKQAEVLDFVEFLVARQASVPWTVERRQRIAAQTMGCLAQTHTSSDTFAARKQVEKTKEERRWTP